MAVEASWGLFDCPPSSCRHDAYRKSSRVFRKQGGDRWGRPTPAMGSRRPRASQYLWDGRQVNRLSSVPSLKNAGWQASQPFNVRSVPHRRLSKPRNNADSRCSSMIIHNRSLRALWDGGEKTAESACRPAPRTIRVLGKHHRKADAHPHPQQELDRP